MSTPGLFDPVYPGSDRLWIDELAARKDYLTWAFSVACREAALIGGIPSTPEFLVTREMWRDAKLIIRLRGKP